jgi:Spy/CpxP family protein refolding chaperone
MIARNSVRIATLLLAGSVAAVSASAQQPAPAPAPPPQPGAQTIPATPRERGPMPDRHFDRGPMMSQRGGGFDHPGMQSEFRIVPPGMWWKNPNLVQRIGLMPDQTKKMDDIFQQSRLQLIDLKANLEKQNLMLEPMLSANPIDQGKAMAQIDKVAQARADLEKANAKMLLGIRGVLTPDQWTKLQTGGREMGRGEGPGAPGPGQGRGQGRGRGDGPSPRGDASSSPAVPPNGAF